MRRLWVVVLAVVISGCGVAEPQGAPRSSGESVPALTDKTPLDPSKTAPPPIVMIAAGAPKQIAVPDSSCVTYTDTSGQASACAGKLPRRARTR